MYATTSSGRPAGFIPIYGLELWALVSGGLDLAGASGVLQGEGGRLLGLAGSASVAVAVSLAVWPPGVIPFLVLWVAGYAILVGILLLVRITRPV